MERGAWGMERGERSSKLDKSDWGGSQKCGSKRLKKCSVRGKILHTAGTQDSGSVVYSLFIPPTINRKYLLTWISKVGGEVVFTYAIGQG